MALLAESLVEEWLNRMGFFTIRGVKQGNGEMDLLAVRQGPQGFVTGWHVEVQVSFKPVGYISNRQGKEAHAAFRSPDMLAADVDAWIKKKFQRHEAMALREKLWPGIKWEYYFVHSNVKHKGELEAFEQRGITLHNFTNILKSLSTSKPSDFTGSAGSDLAAIVSYYKSYVESPSTPNAKDDTNRSP